MVVDVPDGALNGLPGGNGPLGGLPVGGGFEEGFEEVFGEVVVDEVDAPSFGALNSDLCIL